MAMCRQVFVGAAMLSIWAASAGDWQRASADPIYQKAFKATFHHGEAVAKCAVCHQKKDSSFLNDYGERLHLKLGQTRTKDLEAIGRALLEIGPP